MILRRLRRLAFARRTRPTCYLHIGPPKTGTTSIQQVLRARRAALRKAGLHQPNIRSGAGRPHKNECHLAGGGAFVRPYGAPLESTPAWAALSRDLDTSPMSVVLSGETLSSHVERRADYDAIVDFFTSRGYAIRLIAYVRDQPFWLNSWFTQQQKSFRWRSSFDAYVGQMLSRGRVDPWSYLRHPLEDDRVSLDVVSFEQAAARGLERDFLERIGAPGISVPALTIANPNVGAKGVFAAQEAIRRAEALVTTNQNRRPISRVLRTLSAERGWRGQPHMGFDQAGYDAVRARFREPNDRFAQRFFGTDWSELCPPRTVTRCVFDPARASEAERRDVEDVVATLLQRAQDGGGEDVGISDADEDSEDA